MVTCKQRPKGSEGMSLAEIWGKEHHRRRKQPVQGSWGGHIFDVFNKQQGS